MQDASESDSAAKPAACMAAIMAAVSELAGLRRRASELALERLDLVAQAAAHLADLELQVFAAEVRAEEAEARADDAAASLARVQGAIVALARSEAVDRRKRAA